MRLSPTGERFAALAAEAVAHRLEALEEHAGRRQLTALERAELESGRTSRDTLEAMAAQ